MAPSPTPDTVRLLGDPPTSARPLAELTTDEVAATLRTAEADGLLARLGITGTDAEELRPLIAPVIADAELLAEVTATANLLRRGAGLDAPAADLDARATQQDALQARLHPGEGLLAILALVAATDVVRAWHAARGLDEQASWEVLADLGQQMRVHRAARGRLGLHQRHWLAGNWRGRLVHLGRLQFDLHRRDRGTDQERWVIGAHIPARGPLDPAAVEDSLDAATAYFTAHYPDLDRGRPAGAPAVGHELFCESWLVNPLLTEELGADSNLGAFAARWDILEQGPGDDGADGAAFFVFSALPPYRPAELPRRTRLERLVGDRLEDGRGWRTGLGRLVR